MAVGSVVRIATLTMKFIDMRQPSLRIVRIPAIALGLVLTSAFFAASARAQSTTVVISQVYGGGGNAGAPLLNDFVELHNVSDSPVQIQGWSVQYTSATGTGLFSSNVTALSGTLAAGAYYLLQLGGGTNGQPLPTPDATGTTLMSATAGKVALVNSATGLPCNGGSTPCDSAALASIVDLVGYGNANFFEGSGAAPTLSNTTAALRGAAGCTDSNNNSADFASGAPAPRNTASPVVTCDAEPPPPPTCTPTATIAEIQGTGSVSPFAPGTVVGTTGIVTARWDLGSARGFFLQMATGDGDPQSSDGVFVFTGNVSAPALAAVGNEVCVLGPVAEFRPASDPGSSPLTEISFPTLVTLVSEGGRLPAPVSITAEAASPDGGLEALERFEGMRVRIETLRVVAPTGGTLIERDAVSNSNGVFYGVVDGVARPFREAGIDVRDALPAGAPPGVPRFDGNPERIRVDSDALGAPALEVTTGATVTNLVGPLHYAFRTYSLVPEPPAPGEGPVVSGVATARAIPDPTPAEITIASFNLQRFYDTINDPDGDVALTPEAFERRLTKLSLAIRTVLKYPDVLGVEEAEKLVVLRAIADRVNTDAMATGAPNPEYRAALVEGNDIGGIDVGVLVKTTRVALINVVQEGRDATYINPLTGLPELLNDRPPLVAEMIAQLPQGRVPLTVIVNHLRSLNDIDSPTDGARVRAKRQAQAEFLANLVQDRQTANPSERILLVGDFNAFEVNDGYVDSIGTIKGQPTDPSQVVLASPDLVNPDLLRAHDLAPPSENYTYGFDGNAQSLDHILMNGPASLHLSRVAIAHSNADFPESLRGDATRAERISDHDIPVAYVKWAPEEITRFVAARRLPLVFVPGLDVWFGFVEITNVSPATWRGPFHAALEDLPDGVTLVNADGQLAGLPFVTVPAWRVLRPGQTVHAIVIFRAPRGTRIDFGIRVFAGAL
jgi:uncharacterized protein